MSPASTPWGARNGPMPFDQEFRDGPGRATTPDPCPEGRLWGAIREMHRSFGRRTSVSVKVTVIAPLPCTTLEPEASAILRISAGFATVADPCPPAPRPPVVVGDERRADRSPAPSGRSAVFVDQTCGVQSRDSTLTREDVGRRGSPGTTTNRRVEHVEAVLAYEHQGWPRSESSVCTPRGHRTT